MNRTTLAFRLFLVSYFVALCLFSGPLTHAANEPTGANTIADSLSQAWNSDGAIEFERAALFAKLSQAAYSGDADWKSAFESHGFTSSGPIVSGTMMAFVARRGEIAVVVFRGTDSEEKEDWKVNFDVDRVKVDGGHIHHGFSAAYDSLKEKIRGELTNDRPRHLWTTGHSLGGALAVIAAHDLDADFRVHGIMTFGQPMVGQRDLARHWSPTFKGRYQRFVFEGDLVCRLPPRGKHFGSLVWRKRKEIKRSDSRRESKDDEADENEAPPVTDEEFQAIKSAVEEMPKERRRRRRNEPETEESKEASARTPGSRLPGASDHAIKNYVDWLATPAPAKKVVPGEKSI